MPVRPWRPKEFPGVWAEPAISLADPDQFRTYFAPLLAKLEANHIELAGFELGNELNMTPCNGEFPVPGQGKQFGLNDLYHDPEAQQIAKGYLQYLKVLAVLKGIRDHSKLNEHTPIMTAGFGAYEAPEWAFPPPAKPGAQTDMVSVNTTIDLCAPMAWTSWWMPTQFIYIPGLMGRGNQDEPCPLQSAATLPGALTDAGKLALKPM